MTTTDFHVEQATINDVPEIMRLIKELAEYEKALHEVHATEDMLRENIFEKKFAHCILAKEGKKGENGQVIGMALYFFSFSTWLGVPGVYLEDLYVTPTRRNGGIGKVLFGHLAKIAKENNCGRLEWRVLKWNAPSIAFYQQVLGAVEQEDWKGMRLEGVEIDKLEKYLEGRD